MTVGLKKTKGFTLVEVIVVLVILAILAAILIPSFIGWIKKAEDKTVIIEARNCVLAAQTIATEDYAAGLTMPLSSDPRILELAGSPAGSSITELTWNDGTTYVNKLVYRSAGGVIVTYENREYTIGASSSGSFGSKEIMDIITKNARTAGYTDSGAAGFEGSSANTLVKALKTNGIDLEAMGAKTWRFTADTKKSVLYWTPVDISELPAGTTSIPVMRYNLKTGSYSVWKMNLGDGNYKSNHFRILDKETTNLSGSSTDYDSMLKVYAEAVAGS